MIGDAETDAKGRGLKAVSWAMAAACGVLLLALTGYGHLLARSYEGLYRGLNAALPKGTTFVLSLPGWAYVLAAGVLIAVLVVKELLLGGRAAAMWLNVGLVVAGAGAFVLGVHWLSLPVRSLCDALGP